ncbi:MAG: hypothetical protein LJE91_05305 [Gammaproteobacteria bacterium]|nr:hypothetical protein [Gammaproteobacteria bacterium]
MTYFNGSMPVFVHAEQDRASFQTIAAQFCVNGDAKQADIVRAFGVTKISLKRAVKRYREEGPKGYYGLDSLLLLLAFMALARLESIESLRDSAPGEWGNLLGLNRVPQRLCLRATTDYWVNAMDGQPLCVVNQVVDPGLIQVIEHEIVPRPPWLWPCSPAGRRKTSSSMPAKTSAWTVWSIIEPRLFLQPLPVVNPDYRHLDGQVRSATGKLTRRLARFAAMTLELLVLKLGST